MAEESLVDKIEAGTVGPRSFTADGESAVAHSLSEQIAADRYARSVRANATSRLTPGIRLGKISPGSAV